MCPESWLFGYTRSALFWYFILRLFAILFFKERVFAFIGRIEF